MGTTTTNTTFHNHNNNNTVNNDDDDSLLLSSLLPSNIEFSDLSIHEYIGTKINNSNKNKNKNNDDDDDDRDDEKIYSTADRVVEPVTNPALTTFSSTKENTTTTSIENDKR